jgi:GTP-binding protein
MLTPEIAFLGRSNSGKSSLLNALLQAPELCRVGPKPGKTIAMHAWALATSNPRTGGASKGTRGDTDVKLTVLDMPGYGHGSRDEWGQDIIKYLKNRKQLKRAFVLLNPKHGIKDSDEQILQMLRTNGISHQVIASKCDGVKPVQLNALLMELRQKIKDGEKEHGGMGLALDDILAVGQLGDGSMNKKVHKNSMLGIEEVRWAVLRAVGLEEHAHKILAEHRRRKEDIRKANGLDSKMPKRQVEPFENTVAIQSQNRAMEIS